MSQNKGCSFAQCNQELPSTEPAIASLNDPSQSTMSGQPEQTFLAQEKHFSTNEFGDIDKINFTDPEKARFLPRQYFVGKMLYREREARKVTWEELFLDLIFVSVVNRLGEWCFPMMSMWKMENVLISLFCLCQKH